MSEGEKVPVKSGGDYRLRPDEVNPGPLAVLTVVHGLPPGSLGGTEVAALRLAEAIAPDIHTTFFYPGAPGKAGLRRDGRRPIERAEVSPAAAPPNSYGATFLRPEVAQAFRALIEAGAPGTGRPFDLCHIHHLTHLDLGLIHIAKSKGLPVCLTLHDYWLACGRGQLMDLDFNLCDGPSLEGCSRCLGDQLAIGSPQAKIGGALRGLMSPPRGGTPLPKKTPASGSGSPLRGIYGALESLALAISRPPRAGLRALEERGRLAREAFDLSDAVISPSADLLNRFVAMGFLKEPSKGRVLGNIPPPGGPKAVATEAPPLRLIYVGSIIPTKGVHLLIEAMAHFDPEVVTLDILGPTPAYHRAPSYGGDLQSKKRPGVRWLGPLPPEEVGGHIAKAHALVLPSIWPENAPVTLREALIQGVPVIASRIGGIPELVSEGVNGLLFEPGNVMDLVKAIHRMGEPERRARLANGTGTTPSDAIGATSEAWIQVYQDCRSRVE